MDATQIENNVKQLCDWLGENGNAVIDGVHWQWSDVQVAYAEDHESAAVIIAHGGRTAEALYDVFDDAVEVLIDGVEVFKYCL